MSTLSVQQFRELPWVYRHPKRSESSSHRSWALACDDAWIMRRGLGFEEMLTMDSKEVPVVAVTLSNSEFGWFAQSSDGAVLSKGCVCLESERLCPANAAELVACLDKVCSAKGLFVAYDTDVAMSTLKRLFERSGLTASLGFGRGFDFRTCMKLSKAAAARVPEAALEVLKQVEVGDNATSAERLVGLYKQGRDWKLWL